MVPNDLVVDVSQDWMLACDVQRRFMQGLAGIGTSLNYSGHCRQLRALGGDCYDFVPLAGDRLAFVIGDASGKGLAAALMIANVQSSLRTAAMFAGNDLSTLLRAVNHQAYTSSLEERYATVFYGVFEPSTRLLRYVNAGHNPPLIHRQDGSIEWINGGDAPVGMFQDSTYEERIVQLYFGDLVLAYTDGVIEATSHSGEEWGIEGLLKSAAECSGQSEDSQNLVQSIFNSMDAFSGGHQSDDATLAVLRVC